MKKIAFKVFCSLTLLILALPGGLPVPAEGAVLCVTEDGAGDRDGNGWDNACGEADFIHALRHAVSGDEFWISAGRYRPDLSGNVESSFEMKDGVELYGGFSGTETSRDQRDWVTNETTLTGNLLVYSENSKTVVIASGIGNTAVLDGFTITGGRGGTSTKNYDTVEIYVGGGMYNIKGSPTVRNCTFSDNKADYGGAVYNEENYSGDWLYFTNCTFSNNSSNYPRGISDKLVRGGGAVYNYRSPSIFTNCTFSDNSDTSSEPATWYVGGGAVYNYVENISRRPFFTNCTFSGNSAGQRGGAVYNYTSGPLFTNCTFSGNSTSGGGGGGAVYNESYTIFGHNSNTQVERFPTFENCIFWDNTDRQIVNENSVGVSVTYCVVQDGSSGITGGGTISEIISDDPNLQPLGEYGGATKTIAIGPGSSARDKGTSSVFGHVAPDVAKDQRGFPRDGSYDIGSYECRDDLKFLTVAVTELGTVGRAPSGDALTSSNQWIYSRDLPVTLTAVPISSNHFKGWGGALSGTASSTQLTMTEDHTIKASFSGEEPGGGGDSGGSSGDTSAGCQVGGAPLSYFWLLLPLALLRRGKR